MGKDEFDTITEQLLGNRDVDNDSIVNYDDCRPLDPTKQDLRGTFSKVAGKLRSGASKLKEKYKDLKVKKLAREEKKKREAEEERQAKVSKLEKKKQELKRKKELEKLKAEVSELKGPSKVQKVLGFLSSAKKGVEGESSKSGLVFGGSGENVENLVIGSPPDEDEEQAWFEQGLV